VLVQLNGPLLVSPAEGKLLTVTSTVAVLLQLLPMLVTNVKVFTPVVFIVANTRRSESLLRLVPAGALQL
jgi:hypothetical protein